MVRDIGQIEVEQGNILVEQILIDDQRNKLLTQIAILEKKLAKERQPRRKREYFEKIKKFKSQI